MSSTHTPAATQEAQIKLAQKTAERWQNKLSKHGVTVVPLAVNMPYKGGLATKYRIATTHTHPNDPGYGVFMGMLEKETGCRIVPYKSEKCEFDAYQRAETKTFSIWLFIVDMLLTFAWLGLFFVLLGATAHLFPYLPFAGVVRGRVAQVLSWYPPLQAALAPLTG